MLSEVFSWVDAHPFLYWSLGVAASMALLGPAARNAAFRGRPLANPPRWWFPACSFLTLLAWRWPTLFGRAAYNPDEAQIIAGAITLTRNPVFWQSVDGMTSGPLNGLALLPLHALGVPLDYFCARLTALLLVWVALCFLWRTLRNWIGAPQADLTAVATALFFATVSDLDFVHYSSEQVSVALFSVAAFFLVRPPTRPFSNRSAILGGIAAGAIPWAKVQGVPLAGTLLLLALAFESTRTRPDARSLSTRCLTLTAAFLLPTCGAFTLLAVLQVWDAFWLGYVADNFLYVARSAPLGQNARNLYALMSRTHQVDGFIVGSLIVIVLGLLSARNIRLTRSRLLYAGASLFAVSILTVFAPGRPFLHYVLFVPIPLALLLGGALANSDAMGRSGRMLLAATSVAAAGMVGLRMYLPLPEAYGNLAEYWRHPRTTVGEFVRAIVPEGEPVTVWGWNCSIHVESGRPQGTRLAQSERMLTESPLRDRHRAVYMDDLEKNRPLVFVDAVGPGSHSLTDSAKSGVAAFPELHRHLQLHYRPVGDADGARIYDRTDSGHQPDEIESILHQARQKAYRPKFSREPDRVPPDLTWSSINGEAVMRLPPPRALEWNLNEQDRVVEIRYGLEKRSLKEGDSDGVDVHFELRLPPGLVIPLGHSFLNPGKNAAHREEQNLRIVLPPMDGPGKFVLRTAPGPSGNDAWDWVYVRSVLIESGALPLPEQFPGFSRMPREVTASPAHLVDDGTRLMLPAPARLVFDLEPVDQSVEFDAGISPGAYTGSGRTDGVAVRVILTVDDNRQLLFERGLDPLSRQEDAGTQHFAIRIPERPHGARIELQFDPGGSSAWDWSYLKKLDFH